MIRNEQGPLLPGSLYFGPVDADTEDLQPLDAISGVSVSKDTDYDTTRTDFGAPVVVRTNAVDYTFTVDGITDRNLFNLYGIQAGDHQQHAVMVKAKRSWKGPKKPVYNSFPKSCRVWFLGPLYRYRHLKSLWKWRKKYNQWVKDGKPDLEVSYYVPRAYIDTSGNIW